MITHRLKACGSNATIYSSTKAVIKTQRNCPDSITGILLKKKSHIHRDDTYENYKIFR